MATWQPQPQGLSDLLQLLKEAVNPNASQTAITEVCKSLTSARTLRCPFLEIHLNANRCCSSETGVLQQSA